MPATTTLNAVWDTAETPARPARAIPRPGRNHWKRSAFHCATAAGLISATMAATTGASFLLSVGQGGIAFILALLTLLPCAHLLANSQGCGRDED